MKVAVQRFVGRETEDKMGEILWMKFVDECVENLQEVLLTVGVNGLLAEYDRWMEAEGYIECQHGAYCKHTPNVEVSG